MEDFSTVITTAGETKIAALATGGTLTLAQLAVGDGNGDYYDPYEAQIALVNEMWRGDITSIATDPHDSTRRIVTTYIPGSVGGWWIREVGLYTNDTPPVLFAIAKIPAREKVDPLSGSQVGIYIKLYLDVNSAQIEVVPGVEYIPATALYDPALAYVVNKTVSYLGNVYVSVLPVAIGEDPLSYPAKWQAISSMGAAGTIAVGTVITGPAGSEVVIENVGTPEEAIFNITIPKGDPGAPYKAYESLAAANLDLAGIPDNALIWLNSDPDEDNIGYWSKIGGVLVQSSYRSKAFLSGTQPPTAGDGLNGDLWFDIATLTIYGPKTAGAWGAGQAIQAPQGIQGAAGGPLSAVWADVLTINASMALSGYDVIHLGDTNAGALVWTAPTAAGKKGRQIYLENIGTSGNLLTVNGLGAETVEGASGLDLDDGMGRTIYSDGANWRIIKG